jgi:O-antigen ligase
VAVWSLFVGCHAQDIQPLAAPLSFILLALVEAPRLAIPRPPPGAWWCGLGLLAYLVVNIVWHGTWQGLAATDFVKLHGKILYALGLFAFFCLLPVRTAYERWVYPLFIAAGAANALAGIFHLRGWINLASVRNMSLSEHANPFLSFLGTKNDTASLLGAAALVAAVWFACVDRKRWLVPLVLFSLLACMATLLITRSRGYTLALMVAAGGAFLGVVYRAATRRKLTWKGMVLALALAGLGLAGFWFQSDRFEDLANDPNIDIRLALWDRAVGYWGESPLLGVGIGALQQQALQVDTMVWPVLAQRVGGVYPETLTRMDPEGGLHAHNFFVQFGSEAGLVGLGLFCLLLGLLLRQVLRHDPFQLNRCMFLYLLLYLLAAGMTGSYPFASPVLAVPFYFAAARLARNGGCEV